MNSLNIDTQLISEFKVLYRHSGSATFYFIGRHDGHRSDSVSECFFNLPHGGKKAKPGIFRASKIMFLSWNKLNMLQIAGMC